MTYRSEKTLSRAREQSAAQKLLILTRGSAPPLRNCWVPRAGVLQPPEIAESHARERSIAQEMQNPEHCNFLS